MKKNEHIIEVFGPLGCFTMPGSKVERFSYPVITPTALKALYESLYWKPRMQWFPTKVEVISPIKYVSVKTNEIKKSVINLRSYEKTEPISIEENRTQRNNTILQDLHYYLHAEIVPFDKDTNVKALNEQFIHRAKRGKYFHHPYFGCREYPAYFNYIDSEKEKKHKPIQISMDLGLMVYSLFDLNKQGCEDVSRSYFNAKIENGIMIIPDYNSDLVKRG